MLKEFEPTEIKSKIKVYLDEIEVTPLAATRIYMDSEPNVTVDGWIDLVVIAKDENGNPLKDVFGNLHTMSKNLKLEHDYNDYNIGVMEHNNDPMCEEKLKLIPRPEPVVLRFEGKIMWELVK